MMNISSAAVRHEIMTSSLRDVLNRVANEMRGIAETIEDTQSVIATLTWRHASQDPAYAAAMQKADLISQEVAGLAGFIQKLTQTLPGHLQVDATEARNSLTLTDLARRLAD